MHVAKRIKALRRTDHIAVAISVFNIAIGFGNLVIAAVIAGKHQMFAGYEAGAGLLCIAVGIYALCTR